MHKDKIDKIFVFKNFFFLQNKSNSNILMLISNLQQSLACQKTFLNTFNNSINNNTNANLLDNNNFINNNIDINTKVKSNFNENITSRNNDDFYKNNFVTNIKELF